MVWRKGFGPTYTEDDYSDWQDHFGQSSGVGGGSAVPEPASLVLALFGGIMMLSVRRR